MGGEIDIPYFAIMNMAVVVQRVVGIIINPKQLNHGITESAKSQRKVSVMSTKETTNIGQKKRCLTVFGAEWTKVEVAE